MSYDYSLNSDDFNNNKTFQIGISNSEVEEDESGDDEEQLRKIVEYEEKWKYALKRREDFGPTTPAEVPVAKLMTEQKVIFILHHGIFFLGRDPRCDIVFDEEEGEGYSVSTLHALLEIDDTGNPIIFVEDLGSTNGTLINYSKLRQDKHSYQIKIGDILTLGELKLTLCSMNTDVEENPGNALESALNIPGTNQNIQNFESVTAKSYKIDHSTTTYKFLKNKEEDKDFFAFKPNYPPHSAQNQTFEPSMSYHQGTPNDKLTTNQSFKINHNPRYQNSNHPIQDSFKAELEDEAPCSPQLVEDESQKHIQIPIKFDVDSNESDASTDDLNTKFRKPESISKPVLSTEEESENFVIESTLDEETKTLFEDAEDIHDNQEINNQFSTEDQVSKNNVPTDGKANKRFLNNDDFFSTKGEDNNETGCEIGENCKVLPLIESEEHIKLEDDELVPVVETIFDSKSEKTVSYSPLVESPNTNAENKNKISFSLPFDDESQEYLFDFPFSKESNSINDKEFKGTTRILDTASITANEIKNCDADDILKKIESIPFQNLRHDISLEAVESSNNKKIENSNCYIGVNNELPNAKLTSSKEVISNYEDHLEITDTKVADGVEKFCNIDFPEVKEQVKSKIKSKRQRKSNELDNKKIDNSTLKEHKNENDLGRKENIAELVNSTTTEETNTSSRQTRKPNVTKSANLSCEALEAAGTEDAANVLILLNKNELHLKSDESTKKENNTAKIEKLCQNPTNDSIVLDSEILQPVNRGGRSMRKAALKAKPLDFSDNFEVDVIKTPTATKKRKSQVVKKSAVKKTKLADNIDIEDEVGNSKAVLENSLEITSCCSSPVLSLASNIASFRIMFTGVSEDDVLKKFPVMEKLGATRVENWSECTHLVTDKVRRTVKFLCALSAGKHIVDIKWVEACKKRGQLVDEGKFLLKDKTAEATYNFKLEESILKSRKFKSKVFENLKFFSTSSVQPNKKDLVEILEASGGEYLESLPKDIKSDEDSIVVIGCLEDEKECSKIMKDTGRKIFSTEFLFLGILQQKVNFESHRLFHDSSMEKKEFLNNTSHNNPSRKRSKKY
ncbi:Mediator of DNA damage checkpoint protein 1 [Lobulomyces angularis]|nr:Mediator of DNA damage checkpoint protein 1 [Lobulomyces angularis]